MVIAKTQQHIHTLRDEILETLPNARFFIFDPTCTGRGGMVSIPKMWVAKDDNKLTIVDDLEKQVD
jgi:hypothetical protein